MKSFRAPSARVAMVVLGGTALLALLAPLILPDPNVMPDPVSGGLRSPGVEHLLGTDILSRDVLARLARGGALSLVIGLTAAVTSTVLGAGVGLVAAVAGRGVDAVLMRGVDGLISIPRAFVVLFAAAAWDRLPIWGVVALLGITGWYAIARIVRNAGVRLMGTEAILAARALGASRRRIIVRHLLPNIAGQLSVATALGIGEVMLLEAGLSFLGAGIRPPTPSWGGMIHEGKDVLLAAPWVSLAPGIALVLVVLAVNRLGDALRDTFEPRSR
jgi:peptide/nickel transport system permease protein